jgi:hypothetical protein
MFRWSKDYNTGKDNLKERISPYQDKTITVSNDRDIKILLDQLAN